MTWLPHTVSFAAGGDITFADNAANEFGGAVGTKRLSTQPAEFSSVVNLSSDANIVFTNNYSGANSTTAAKNGGGGAFYIDAWREDTRRRDYGSIIAAGNVTFVGNHADNNAPVTQGGAVYAGGAVSIDAGGDLTFTGNYINTAESGQGGAIAVVLGGSLYLGDGRTQNVVLTNNHVSGDKADDSIVLQGGAVYIARGDMHLNAVQKIALTGNYAHTNHALAAGGAVYVGGADGAASLALSAPLVEITGNYVSAAAGDDDGHTAKGGALYNENGSVSVTAAQQLTMTNNYAHATTTAWGGAVNVHAGSLAVNVKDAQVSGNSVTADGAPDAQEVTARGGALYSTGSVVWTTAEGGTTTFADNTATSAKIAGGPALWASADITFEGGSIAVTGSKAKSTATSTAGDDDAGAFGAVTLKGGHLNVNSAQSFVLTGNEATGPMARGGATALRAGTLRASARQLTYADNSATATSDHAFGGAVYTAGGAGVAVAYAALTGNKAESTAGGGIARGGAVYAGDAMTWVTGDGGKTEFSGNIARAPGLASGAAVYAHGDLTFNGGDLDVNANSSDAGSTGQAFGAFVLGDGHLKISTPSGDVNFAENTARGATASGGAFALRVGEVDVNAASVTFENNKAIAAGGAAQGGAFFAEGDSTVAVTAGTLTIKGNSAEAAGGNALGGALNSEGGAFNVTVNTAGITGNTVTAAGENAMARGGAVFAGGDLTWKTAGRTTFSGNRSTGETLAGGAAIAALNSLTIDGGIVVFEDNHSVAANGEARGALAVDNGHLKIKTTGANEQFEFVGNTARGTDAHGGGVTVLGGDADVSSTTVDFEGNKAIAASGTAMGGAIYSSGIIDFDATRTLYVRNNSAEKASLMMLRSLSSAATTADTRGGGFYASGDIHITIGHDGSASAEEETAVGRAVFSGNTADLGGALYSENGNITLTRAGEAGGVFDFATAADDVFARRGNISITGMLIAKPGTSFTAAKQFSLEHGSSVTLEGKTFTDDPAKRSANDLTIFAGHNEQDIQSSINFNRGHITLLGHDNAGQQMTDIAAVMYQSDPGIITNGISADITDEAWALDVSDYRAAKLWMHSAISHDTETEKIQNEEIYAGQKGYGYLAKLVLAYERRTLIWRGLENYNGSQPKWNEADKDNLVWLMAKDDDYFTPREIDGYYVPDSFYRGDIVVFDGKVYNDGANGPTSADVLSGDDVNDRRPWTVPLYAHYTESGDEVPNISASEIYITGGQYVFTGDENSHLRTDLLIISGDDDPTRVTSADFKLPVRVWENLSVGTNADATFTNLFTLENTPVSIAGTMSVQSPTNGAYTVHGGGSLTLGGGSGMVNSLSVLDGAALNINTLGAYKVNGSFTAEDGSHTVVTPSWNANEDELYALMGEGEASATVGEKAKLTLRGIGRNSTGKWTLLENFTKGVNATDNQSWGNIDAQTLAIMGADTWNAPVLRAGDTDAVNKLADGAKYYQYEVKKEKDGKDYVLIITEHVKGQEEKEVVIPENPLPEESETPQVDPKPTPPPVISDDVPEEEEPDPTDPPPPTDPEEPVRQPEQPGHTEVFHIAGSVQRALSRAAVEPRPNKHLWATFWRDTGRVYDTRDDLALKTRAYGVIIGRDLSKDYKKTWGLAAHIGKGDTKGKGWWDGSTSDTNFWGVMLYGRRDEKKWFFTGDASFNWFKTDYTEANGSSADNARSTMFSVGGRAYYKWIDNPQPGQMSVHPFIGARWNYYRQSGYTYDTGNESRAWKSGQLHVPMGIKIQWGEMESKDGWHVTPTLEASYIRTIGQRSAVTGIHAPGQARSGVRMPLSARDTFAAEFRYVTRNEKKGFHWELNAGVRRSTSEKDLHVGTTFKWEL